MTSHRSRVVLLLLFGLSACHSAPATTIPEALPETLAWARSDTGAGAFFGLKTRENDGGSLDDLLFQPGVRVVDVVERSPASEAGFRVGDVVLGFGDHRVDDPGTLRALVKETEAGKAISVDVRRGDSVFAVLVTLRAAAGAADGEPELLYRVDPSRSGAGWATGHGGVVLVSSHEDAPFPSAGVDIGSVVLAVGGRSMKSDRALIRYLGMREPGDTVEVVFRARDSDEIRTEQVRLRHAPQRVTGFKFPILWKYASNPEGMEVEFTLLDLWVVWLFRYERDGKERSWSLLRFFRFEYGVGELQG